MTHASDRSSPQPRRAWRYRSVIVATALGTLGAGAAYAYRQFRAARLESKVLGMIDSDDVERRKRGAWAAAEFSLNRAYQRIQDSMSEEPSPAAREAFIYALGRRGSADDFDRLIAYARGDASGYVRQAAWVAAARSDPTRTRGLLEPLPPGGGPWDKLGVAQAWLVLRDVRGIDKLFDFAAGDDHSRRIIAARALSKAVRPVLDSLGRWPLDADAQLGQAWPRGLVDEVRRRCARIDLQTALEHTDYYWERSQQVRRNKARLTGARERIAGFLFGN